MNSEKKKKQTKNTMLDYDITRQHSPFKKIVNLSCLTSREETRNLFF